jgi:hypothetical protein
VLHEASGRSEATRETLHEQVEDTLRTLHKRSLDRKLRELRVLTAAAEQRGDQAMLHQLTQQRMQILRELRLLD